MAKSENDIFDGVGHPELISAICTHQLCIIAEEITRRSSDWCEEFFSGKIFVTVFMMSPCQLNNANNHQSFLFLQIELFFGYLFIFLYF